jgi:hypothetical protein
VEKGSSWLLTHVVLATRRHAARNEPRAGVTPSFAENLFLFVHQSTNIQQDS